MPAVLIYTDNKKIDEEKSILNRSVAYYQSIYDSLKAIGITTTLQKIQNLVSFSMNGNGVGDFTERFVLDELLAIAGDYTFGGVKLSQAKLKEMIEIPDLINVKVALNGCHQLYTHSTKSTRINLLSLVDGIVIKIDGADDSVSSLYTYYTKKTTSAALATSLLTVCASLNAHNELYNNALTAGLGNAHYGSTTMHSGNSVMPGISIENDVFVIDLKYIRDWEDSH